MDSSRKMRLRELRDWVENSVTEISPSEPSAIDCVFDLSDEISAGDTVLVALPSGRQFLATIVEAMARNIRPVLVPSSMPWPRIFQLASSIGAKAAILPKGRSTEGHVQLRADTVKLVFFAPEGLLPIRCGDLAILTSGTSGFRSGCLFRLDQLLENALLHSEAIGLKRADTTLAVLPLSFSYSFVAQVLAAFLTGGTLVIAAPPFSPASVMDLIMRHQITVTGMTPFLIRQILASAVPFPANLRLLTIGGDQIAGKDVSSLLKLYGHGELYLTYGLTEAGPRVCTFSAHDEPCHRFGSVGRPMRGIATWLKDRRDDGSGLLTIQTPTAALQRLGIVDANNGTHLDTGTGLVYTGDVFRIDDDGYHYFLGRASDFIMNSGHKVCLASIRKMAETIEGVTRARTEVLHDPSSAQRYRLLLYTGGVNENHVHRADMSKFLMQLRPHERPAQIDWLSIESTGPFK